MLLTDEVWHPIDGVNLVRACMMKQRFKELMPCLKCDGKSTRSIKRAKDAFVPFRDIWDQFNSNLSQPHIAGSLLTLMSSLSFLGADATSYNTFQANPPGTASRYSGLPSPATYCFSWAFLTLAGHSARTNRSIIII